MRRISLILLAGAAGCVGCTAYGAQPASPFPTKPVRLVVTFPPGGSADIVARTVGAKLTSSWAQQVIIDNRSGAAGTIGTEIAARAAPDGHTLLLGSSGALVVNPLMGSKLGYDPARDFAPISLLVVIPQLLVVNSSLPVGTVSELIAFAKARPGKLNYASVGQGSPNHLAMELFKSMTGVDVVHVPFKGAGPAITDLLGGQVQVMFNPMPALLPHVKTGKLRPLGVGSTRRSTVIPEVPTVAEAGVPGFEYVLWYALLAPARTPKATLDKLNADVVAALADAELAQRLSSQGAEPRSTTAAELARFIADETRRLKKVIDAARIRPES